MAKTLKILSTSTLLPPYSYSSENVLEYVKKWVSTQDLLSQKKTIRIFKSAKISKRHSIIPIEEVFNKKSLTEKNEIYKKNAISLGTEVLKRNLEKSKIKPEEIDYLITTSCTGFMIPSLDAYIANNLSLRSDVKRLPLTEMGCVAGVTALIFANDFLKAYPNKKVAIISLEFPSNTIQLEDYSLENMVGSATFADGVSCIILGCSDHPGFSIIDTQMLQIPNTTNILGYSLINSGFRMNLDAAVPNVIAENLMEILIPFLNKNKLSIDSINNFIVHPGGIKILNMIEKILKEEGKHVNESKYIMEKYGNMSSATIGFIIDHFINKNITPNKKTAVVLGFGPGFVTHCLILEWRE